MSDRDRARAPLAGVRVVELAGLGPAPFAAMVLADLGADVVRIDRPAALPAGATGATGAAGADDPARDLLRRGRRSVVVDLAAPAGRALVRELVDRADVLVEGFRPGVAERLGLGPGDVLATNPRLVHLRVTGWGQDGPLASTAGHDITYLARSGLLARFRRADGLPVPPANLLGDLGAGAMPAVVGVLAALLERERSGRGQVVDAAIVDGAHYLETFLLALEHTGRWGAPPGHNVLDTGAPYYDVHRCADGRFVAVGAIEDRFYARLLDLAGVRDAVDDAEWDLVRPGRRTDPATWPGARAVWARLFAARPRDAWAALFAGSDACVEPVLEPDEVAADPQAVARSTYLPTGDPGGVPVPAPAPRLSRTPARPGALPTAAGAATDEVLRELGRTEAEIAALRRDGVVDGPATSPPRAS